MAVKGKKGHFDLSTLVFSIVGGAVAYIAVDRCAGLRYVRARVRGKLD